MSHIFTKYTFRLLTTSALFLVTVACSSNEEHRNYNASAGTPNTYVEGALAGQGDVSLFYQALLSTGVANEMNAHTEYTIFAPTNAALSQISPRLYPCFYAVQCRPQVAAILRNHIVPKNESVDRFSKAGGDIVTLGNRRLNVEEPFRGHYTVEGYRVLYQNETNKASSARGNKINLYRIDGVIASDQEMMPLRTAPLVAVPAAVMEKTVTTYRSPVATTYAPQTITPNGYLVPGGQSTGPVIYREYPDIAPDGTTETTTVTHTTTTE